MAEELKPTPKNKPSIIDKIKLFFKNIKDSIEKNQKIKEIFSKLKTPNTNAQQAKNSMPFAYILTGVSVGFVFGAFISSIMLYHKIKDVQQEYQKTQERLKTLTSKMNSMQTQVKQNKTNNTNQLSELNPAQVINNLPNSNAFASFYIEKLNTKKQQEIQKQFVSKESKPKPLPSLKQLIKQTPISTPLVNTPPPIPKISMIICSGTCYAISKDGQVYTNGYQEGDYALVVNQNQVYWMKK